MRLPQVGDRVTLRGGFEEGIRGTVVANEPTAERPYRFVVECPYPTGDPRPPVRIGGLHPINIDIDD